MIQKILDPGVYQIGIQESKLTQEYDTISSCKPATISVASLEKTPPTSLTALHLYRPAFVGTSEGRTSSEPSLPANSWSL